MTDKEIIRKAIEKSKVYRAHVGFEPEIKSDLLREFLFSHKFAKAFWGTKRWNLMIDFDDSGYTDEDNITGVRWYDDEDMGTDGYISLPAWKYHLQQMVLEKNPLKYLEQFLK